MADYLDVVDLARYPINNLEGGPGRRLVQACRDELATTGATSLPGFLRPEAVAEMVDLGLHLSGQAWHSDQTHTVYFEPVDTSLPAGHPRAVLNRSAKKGIAYDHLPGEAPIRRLYESDDMTCFVASVLGKARLFRSADPLDALQITLFEPGDELGWHFDRSEFSVTLMYQPGEKGGHFDYVAGIRGEDREDFDAVQEVLEGRRSGTRLPAAPGTLALFHGRHALHRVTPVEGARSRINSVLTYGEDPGMRLNDLTSLLFYGRTSSAGS